MKDVVKEVVKKVVVVVEVVVRMSIQNLSLTEDVTGSRSLYLMQFLF